MLCLVPSLLVINMCWSPVCQALCWELEVQSHSWVCIRCFPECSSDASSSRKPYWASPHFSLIMSTSPPLLPCSSFCRCPALHYCMPPGLSRQHLWECLLRRKYSDLGLIEWIKVWRKILVSKAHLKCSSTFLSYLRDPKMHLRCLKYKWYESLSNRKIFLNYEDIFKLVSKRHLDSVTIIWCRSPAQPRRCAEKGPKARPDSRLGGAVCVSLPAFPGCRLSAPTLCTPCQCGERSGWENSSHISGLITETQTWHLLNP